LTVINIIGHSGNLSNISIVMCQTPIFRFVQLGWLVYRVMFIWCSIAWNSYYGDNGFNFGSLIIT